MPVAPRVESRRRTKNACLTCQKRKLKCNGLLPCATCSSRSQQCTYANGSSGVDRTRDQDQRQANVSQVIAPRFTFPTPQVSPPQIAIPNLISNDDHNQYSRNNRRASIATNSNEGGPQSSLSPHVRRDLTTSTNTVMPGLPVSLNSNQSEKEARTTTSLQPSEVAEVSRSTSEGNVDGESLKEQSRMLQDGKGRLLYLGDSASLSYLDTFRRLVESTLGPSDFTKDENKYKLLERSISTDSRPTHVLPDREAAEFLVDSFFSNTVGIIYIFDRREYGDEVAEIYANPLQAEQSRLSILNLVFAVGIQMTMSSPMHSFRGSQILRRLNGNDTNRADMFYLNATHLKDPVSGFEDGDITSIQALLLITVFMLTVAKRNAAWAYLGMAVRSAYALGLHREQTAFAFTEPERRARKNVWRSLYVMDCFLSAMLGRPNGIDNRHATAFFIDSSNNIGDTPDNTIELEAIISSVQASRLVGDILSNVYSERKISVKLAHSISKKFYTWKNTLPKVIDWQSINQPGADPMITLAQLHINLSYFHGIILLTRPFLLQRILDLTSPPRNSNWDLNSPETHSRSETGSASAEPFPGACVKAALCIVDAVQSALLKRAVPQRDPFVIYWLFAASLIIFSNSFCTVYSEVDSALAMNTAIALHQYFGKVDPLACRYLQILETFKEAIAENTVARSDTTNLKAGARNIFSMFFEGWPDGVLAAGLNRGQHMQAGGNHSQEDIIRGRNSRGSFRAQMESIGQQGMMGVDMSHQIPVGSDFGISPPDYSLNFDAFLSGVNQDIEYQQDLWMPLYGTMGVE